eukprot:3778347-Pleurochrysis_carterae.AAC.2
MELITSSMTSLPCRFSVRSNACTVFERKEYDVTDNCAKCCAAITIVGLLSLCDEQRLVLEPEEVGLLLNALEFGMLSPKSQHR